MEYNGRGAESQNSSQDKETWKYCPKCGRRVIGTAQFCDSCGASLAQQISPKKNEGKQISGKKSGSAWKIILGIAGAIIVVIVVISIFSKPDDSETGMKTPSETISTKAAEKESTQEASKSDQEAAAEKQEQKEQYKAECQPFQYREFFRYEDKYKGTKVKVDLRVSQVMDKALRCYSYSEDGFGQEDEYVIQDDREEKNVRILQDDIITVWGEYIGSTEITRALNGVSENIPTISAKYISIAGEEEETQVQSVSGNAGSSAVPAGASDIFGSGDYNWSWESTETGYYLVPFIEGGIYNIWFTTENNTIWANTVYTVTADTIEETVDGGISCKGAIYLATKSGDDYNGQIEIKWSSPASGYRCTVTLLDKGPTAQTDMEAADYEYYGVTDDSVGGGGTADSDWESEFVFPYSDTDLISDDALRNATDEQLRIGKNEIYANHGRMFTSEDLQQYFNSCSWYVPSVAPEDFNENVFNQTEKENIKRIQAEIDRRK